MRLNKSRLSMDLPKVGDRLTRVMTEHACEYDQAFVPKQCVVTYVNKQHGWYQVKFTDTGITECYGLPIFDHSILCGMNLEKGESIPVVCIETGVVYMNLRQCAYDLGITHGEISRQLAGERSHCRGYHFDTVL